MIKENQKLFNRLNILSDAVVPIIAVALSYLIVFYLLGSEKNYPLIDYTKLALLFIPVQVFTFGCVGLYDSYRTSTFGKELVRIIEAFFIDGLVMIAMLYIFKIINFSRWALAIFLLLDVAIVAAKRLVLRTSLKRLRASGYNKKHVIIIGGGEIARHYLDAIRSEKEMGFECAGYISEEDTLDATRLGGFDDILKILDEYSFSEAVCALEADETRHMSTAVEACELTGTKLSVIPVIYRYMSATPAIDMVGGIPMMNIRRIPLDNMGNAFIKRTMDVVGSLVMIILSSPIMLISALIIKLTMGGNVIFKQQRVGLNKKIFTMYKLKSMKDNDTSDTAWSTDKDPRKTRFGAFIRKFSIDELPQLFNVLKGDMSLVGPRPEIPYYVDSFKHSIPMYMLKHQVKPGMTGLAQVNGYRGDTSIQKRIEYDIEYIETWNVFLDISILIKTVLMGFVNKEKLKTKERQRKTEKYLMNKQNQKLDLGALIMFFPAVVAMAIIPIVMRATMIVSGLLDDMRYFAGTYNEENNLHYMTDVYSQGKAMMVVVFAVIMLVFAVVCCTYLFRNVEKRSFVYVGASVTFVLLSLASALGSEYQTAAWYGVFDRAEGFFTLACYFVLFLFTMYAFRKTQNFGYIVGALMFCTGVNIIIGLFQYTGNNLLNYEWFESFIIDGTYKDMLQLKTDVASEKGKMYGALYHYNYVGSFMGMTIPLFTVLAIYGKTLLHKIVAAVFAAGSLFMLLASTARSGLVAVAAAFIVGIIVFARVLIRRWKIVVPVIAAAAVLVVGVNFAMDNALFRRIPSLLSDVVDFVTPAEDADLYDTLPIREITHNPDGTLSLTSQTDTATISFDADKLVYVFTDSEGKQLDINTDVNGITNIADEDFPDVFFEFVSSDDNPYYDDAFFMWFRDRDDTALLFKLFNEKQIHMLDIDVGDRTTAVNAEAIGFSGKEKLGSSRGYIWSRTLPLLKNCTVTGYGPDNFVYAFPQNDYLAKFYAYAEGFHITVDKPHNLYLQIAVNNGIIALIAFLVICVFYLVDCFRLYALKKKYRLEQTYGISVMLAIVGYLAAGLFNDSVVSVAPVFWILLGVGAALNTINRRMDREASGEEELVTAAPRKSKKQLRHEAELDKQAADLASSIRGTQAEKAEADRKHLEELMEKMKASAAAEEEAKRQRAERQKQRDLAKENAPKKQNVTAEEASAMLERVRALREKAEAQAAARNSEDDKE